MNFRYYRALYKDVLDMSEATQEQLEQLFESLSNIRYCALRSAPMTPSQRAKRMGPKQDGHKRRVIMNHR